MKDEKFGAIADEKLDEVAGGRSRSIAGKGSQNMVYCRDCQTEQIPAGTVPQLCDKCLKKYADAKITPFL